MAFADWALLFTTLLAPLLAVQAQKYLERGRTDHDRKINIYKTLMWSRATAISNVHVQALNAIDLEFLGGKYQLVRTDWKALLDHLGDFPKDQPPERASAWDDRRKDLTAKLLLDMGNSLGYHFDEVHIKKGSYLPEAHTRLENEQQAVRDGMLNILSGKNHLKMDVMKFPVAPDAAIEGDKIRKAFLELLEGKQSLKVTSAID